MVDNTYDEIDEEYYEKFDKIDFCFNKINESELKDFLKVNEYELVDFDKQEINDPVWLVTANKMEKKQKSDEVIAVEGVLFARMLKMLCANSFYGNDYGFDKHIFYVNEYTFFCKELVGDDIDFSKEWQLFLYKKFGQSYIYNLNRIEELQVARDSKKELNQNDKMAFKE